MLEIMVSYIFRNKMAVQSADLLRKVFLERKRTGAKLQATQGC